MLICELVHYNIIFAGMRNLKYNWIMILFLATVACSKEKKVTPAPPPVTTPTSFAFSTLKVNGTTNGFSYNNINPKPVIKISFSAALNPNSIAGSVTFSSKAGAAVVYTTTYENHDSTMVITPATLQPVTQYTLA